MPEKDVIRLDLNVEETLKIVVFCGIVILNTFDIVGTKLVRTASPAAEPVFPQADEPTGSE